MSTRPITDTLRHIGGGVFIDTASDKLAERRDPKGTPAPIQPALL